MKQWYIACALLAIGAAAGGALSDPPARTAPAPVWLSNYAAAQKIAQETGKPLFVVFRCER